MNRMIPDRILILTAGPKGLPGFSPDGALLRGTPSGRNKKICIVNKK